MLNIFREVSIKTQWDKTMQPLEWLKLKRLTIPSVDEEVEELELLYVVDGNAKWQPLWIF